MTDFPSLHLIIRILTAIVIIGFLISLVHIINSAKNDLEWADLISVPGRDGGRQRASWNEIGKGLGVVLCVWLPAVYVYSPKMDATGIALILVPVLAYLGGVSAYAASLRSKQASVTTTLVTEPAVDPTTVKTTSTVVETAPVAPKPIKGKK